MEFTVTPQIWLHFTAKMKKISNFFVHCLICVIPFSNHYLVLSHKILGKEHVSMQLLLILTQMFLICMLPVFTEVVWHLRKHYALVWLVGFQHLWMYQSLFQFNPFTPRRDKHVTSPYNILTISLHYPANGLWEYTNWSGRSCYLDLTPNSCHYFTWKCIAAGGENYQSDLRS